MNNNQAPAPAEPRHRCTACGKGDFKPGFRIMWVTGRGRVPTHLNYHARSGKCIECANARIAELNAADTEAP